MFFGKARAFSYIFDQFWNNHCGSNAWQRYNLTSLRVSRHLYSSASSGSFQADWEFG